MKKLLTSLCVASALATVASADFLRVEMGAGGWSQTPSGYIDRKDGDGALSLNGKYTSAEKESTEFYVWALLKHPVPLLPNLRLEYVSLSDEGPVDGKVGGISIPATGGYAKIDTDQYDIIPYYNILDNTFWITLDLGLDLKYIDAQSDVNEKISHKSIYSGSDSVIVPLLYARGRVQLPITGLGAEADIKYITDGDSTVYDVRAKVDYTFDITPVIQPGIEVGYRIEKIDVVDGEDKANLEYKGVYAGVMLRF